MIHLTNELHSGKVFLIRGSGEDWRARVIEWCDIYFKIRPTRFAYAELGKPYFPDFPEIEFSVSHTRKSLCVAFSTHPVGVDIEFLDRRVRSAGLAERYFHPAEADFIRNQDDAERDSAFLRLWTAKESCVKLTGEGIYRGLSKCHVEPHKSPPQAVQNGRIVRLQQWTWSDGLLATVAAWDEFQLECIEQ